MTLRYQVIPVTAFQQNCSIVWCSETMKGVVIDPGGDVAQIVLLINELGVNVEHILLTHGHLDHVGGAQLLANTINVAITGPHQDDLFWLQNLEDQSRSLGLPLTSAFEPSQWLKNNDVIHFGKQSLKVLHTPGHTPGHVVFYNEEAKTAFVGDLLFYGSVGRTDFPQGNFNILIHSIKSQLWPLGDDVRFVPGHGPQSTFGHERVSNPFVANI